MRREAQRLRSIMHQSSDTERRTNFDLIVQKLAKERGRGGATGGTDDKPSVVPLASGPAELHEFVSQRLGADVKEEELVVLAQVVCFWDARAMPWCLHVLANTDRAGGAGGAGGATRTGSSSSGAGARCRDATAGASQVLSSLALLVQKCK